MDKYVMDIRLQNWIPIFEAQARSDLDKQTFCKQNGISRGLFFKWQRILRERIADGFNPGCVSAPTVTAVPDTKSKDDHTSFFEITPSLPSSLIEQAPPNKNEAQRASVVDVSSSAGHVCISYGSFSVSLSGEVDETSLTSILRAVKHA